MECPRVRILFGRLLWYQCLFPDPKASVHDDSKAVPFMSRKRSTSAYHFGASGCFLLLRNERVRGWFSETFPSLEVQKGLGRVSDAFGAGIVWRLRFLRFVFL